MILRYCAVVALALALLCDVLLPVAGSSLSASTVKAMHVVREKRYESFHLQYSEYACFMKDKGRASDRIIANTEEPLPDMRRVLPRLAHQTILFVGDSVVRLQYTAFAALVWEADTSCTSKRSFVHSKRFNFTVAFQWSRHILGIQYEGLGDDLNLKGFGTDVSLKISGNYKYPFGKRVPTVLLLSTNHHWAREQYMKNVSGSLKGKVDMDVLRAGAARINTLLEPFSHRTRIIWRAVSARHFMSGEWNSGGTCSRTVPYSAEELVFYLANDQSFSPLDAIKASAVLRAEADSSGYEFLDILPYSVPRSDGVVGVLHDKQNVIDCTHYCIPGVPDVWNTAFLNHIFAQVPTRPA